MPNLVDEKLIERAQSLLAFLNQPDAADHLKREGIDGGSAFLAVKAASLAPTLPIKPARA